MTAIRKSKTQESKLNVYETVTNKIVEAIERGAGTWQMPWHKLGSGNAANPINLNGRNYRGANVIALWAECQLHGYTDSVWGTYKAFQDRGAQVRKGEKGTTIVFWKAFNTTSINPDNGEETTEKHLMARGYTVFNVAQVDNYVRNGKPVVELPLCERIAHAERFFEAIPVVTKHGGDRAFYVPSGDYVQLPEFVQFKDAESYYSTRGHECVHATGHKSRLDRNLTGRFGSDSYAAEELVAELGAAMLAGHLGIENEPRPDHAAYLQSWLRVLKADSRAIFTAASKSQAAVDHLIALAGDIASADGADDDESDFALAA